MQIPAILQGDSLTRLMQGAAAGAAITVFVGFNWGGWVLGSTAKDMVNKSTTAATVAALAPICVDKFRHADDASGNLTALKKVSSWEQGPFVAKGGWATMPGSDSANSAVADACANLLSALK